ncbi:MAG: heme o synthase [Crocinitomicaceae bacterium]|nr:heme o synthase [Crocinitomicaceae bacterium]
MPNKLKQYISFTKFRLSFLVVVSALSGYLFNGGSDYYEIFLMMIGGMLVTAASNGSNQIWEKDIDGLMKRTAKRPLPLKEMSLTEAYIVVAISLLVGLIMLAMINWPSFYLGLAAYISYVFIYTPLKRITPWAVFVGAFPGAIPPMLGAIAATGEFGFIPGILFFVQFTWQFPHFWAIAWVVDADYRAGGFRLLPSKKGKSKESAFQIALYSLALIPFSLLPWWLEMTGTWTLIIGSVLGAWFFLLSYKLFLSLDDKDARKLMFASFVYLPIIQFVYVFDKI